MVDWDLVDKRRAKGWDWDRIAEDPRIGFHAEEGAGDPGRALRALYYQRRSKSRRTAGDSDRPEGAGDGGGLPRSYSPLAWIGLVVAPLFGIWFLLALLFPSYVGTYFAAVPWIGILLAAAALLLAFGLLRSAEKWSRAFRTPLVIGIALGLVIAAVLGGISLLHGCPTLTTSTRSEPGGLGWDKANNPAWTQNGVPVVFFYGSVACPYCSASSWPLATALQAFGTLSGTSQGHSSSTDVYPNTPEVVLAGATLTSQYAAIHVDESTNDASITTPATPSCTDQAYVSTYDSTGSIPFVVIGGVYIHVGTLVDPGQLRTTPGDSTSPPDSYADVQGQITNQSGPAWTVNGPQVYFIEALLVKLNHGQPAALANQKNVQNYLNQIT